MQNSHADLMQAQEALLESQKELREVNAMLNELSVRDWLRELKEMLPPATLVSSPYDHEARFSTKRGNSWVEYKVHLTESCDDDAPRLALVQTEHRTE